METKVIGVQTGYLLEVVELPFSEKFAKLGYGDEVIFKDPENKEEYGVIKYVNRNCQDKDKVLYTSKILRKATPNDIQKIESHINTAKSSLEKCNKIVENLGLDMRVFSAGYSFDASKLYFLFNADDRVDFRDLVKELAQIMKKQIHLHQIGPRDKAKLIGGYGKCGRPLCCSTWLGKLESISMEMVREQALEGKGSSKLSGACGKLLCCLKYEVEAYKELRKLLPSMGSPIVLKTKSKEFDKKNAKVIGLDILNQKVKILFDRGEFSVVDLSEISSVSKEPSKLLKTT